MLDQQVLALTEAWTFEFGLWPDSCSSSLRMKYKSCVPLLTLAAVAGSLVLLPAQPQSRPRPDNTEVNRADKAASEPTADQAKDNTNDREIMKEIRKSIVSDKSLSTYAHNVKVISQDGKVTLKGPVRSAEERTAIEEKAASVAGPEHVTNEITVKADTKKKDRSE